MHAKLVLLLLLIVSVARVGAAETLTLAQALALALEKNPELVASSADIRAAEARRVQVSRLPNPELEVEVENVAGSGEFSGTDAAEATLQLSQLIELGGKRGQRTRAAALERDVAQLDYDALRLDVWRRVTQEFVAVLQAQRRLELAEQALALTEKFAPAAQRRVEAGAASPVELTRFNLQTATARNDREQARQNLSAARKRLAAFWGSAEPQFERATGDLEKLPTVPPPAQAADRLSQTPSVRRWEQEQARRQAAVALERANAFPDVTVGAGVRHFNEPGENAAVLGLSVPLPLFHRNQGALAEARANSEKADAEQRAALVQRRSAVALAYESLAAAQAQITTLRETILPQAQEAFDAVNEGYSAGRFSYLEVVDAQNTLIESKLRFIEALATAQQAVAEIEGLTGQPLNQLFSGE